MEFLVDLVTTVPKGTSQEEIDNRRAAEAVRAAELAKAGHLVRLWRPPLGPGEWRSIGPVSYTHLTLPTIYSV